MKRVIPNLPLRLCVHFYVRIFAATLSSAFPALDVRMSV